jgi:hypothetical protein
MTKNDTCRWCGHPTDPHAFALWEGPEGEPLYAGLVRCHVAGCTCRATWAAKLPDGTLVGGEAAQRFLDEAQSIIEAELRSRKAKSN